MASQHSPPVEALDTYILAACVSNKGSCAEVTANPLVEEPFAVDVATMGLYVVGEQCTRLVAWGKLFDSATTIHNFPYAGDLVRDSHNHVPKPVGPVERCNTIAREDLLGELMKILYDVYQRLVELPWDGMKFGIPNWLSDGTTLHIEAITTLRKKWATYFLAFKNMRS
ncbi:hypothetical protein HKD37_01G001730 [Glycine soja]